MKVFYLTFPPQGCLSPDFGLRVRPGVRSEPYNLVAMTFCSVPPNQTPGSTLPFWERKPHTSDDVVDRREKQQAARAFAELGGGERIAP